MWGLNNRTHYLVFVGRNGAVGSLNIWNFGVGVHHKLVLGSVQ